MIERMGVLCAAIALSGCGLVERDREAGEIEAPLDGAWLAYKVRGEGASAPSALFVTQPGVKDTTQPLVESASGVFDVVWSPGDELLAVSANFEHGDGRLELVRVGAEGVRERRVLDVSAGNFSSLLWSPDGRYLAYSMGGAVPGELRVADVASGTSPLTLGFGDGIEMAWSPTSDAIAFVADGDAGSELRLARSDEGFVPRGVPLPNGVHRPQLALWHDDSNPERATGWSPTGSWLAFLAREQQDVEDFGWQRVFLTDEHASQATLVSPAQNSIHPLAGGVLWSPDETLISYEDTTPSTDPPLVQARYAVSFDDGVVGEPVEIGADEARIRWVEDRRLLSIEKVAFDEMRATFVDLAAFPAVSVTELFSLDRSCHEVEIHAESRDVVMACSKKGEQHRGLWLWDPSRPAPSQVFTAESLLLIAHGWSPAGESFAFHSRSGEQPSPLALHQVRVLNGDVELVDDDARQWQKAEPSWVEPWNTESSAYFFTRKDGTLKVRSEDAPTLFTLAGGGDLEAFGAAWQRAGYDSE